MEAGIGTCPPVVETGAAGMSDVPKRPLIVRTFMTHEMGDADIVALSTGRDGELSRIIGAITRSRRASPGALQHVVLYGSRGFGKSFMTRRVQIEVEALDDGAGSVAYVLLPEEQHNLQRSPHAFLDTIALRLANREASGDNAFEDALFQWPRPGEEKQQWRTAMAALENAIDATLPEGRGLVIVVVENFDILLATLFRDEEDEQRLRAWLDRTGNRVMLLATATGTVDIDYDRPLFKAFEPVRLAPWTSDDCIAYFNRQRAHEGRTPLDPGQTAKARAIADFIGGTPRLAQLLAKVLDTQDALTVAETMSALADELAEYYRRRIEDLPPLGRGLLDALIRGGEPASQTELAERVGAKGQSTIARVMDDLQRADIVRGRPAPDSRETLYSVTDRVFVHYYRLRQGSRTARTTPLATILDFLRSFYSRDEQRVQALGHLAAGRPAEGGLFSRLALEGETWTGNDYQEGFASRLDCALEAAHDALGMDAATFSALLDNEPEAGYEICRKIDDIGAIAASIIGICKAQALYRLGHINDAKAVLDNAITMSEENPVAKFIASEEFSIFILYNEKNSSGAAIICQRMCSIPTTTLPPRLALRCLISAAWSYCFLSRHKEAVAIAIHASELARQIGEKRDEAIALRHMAFSLHQLSRFDEALDRGGRSVGLARQAGERREEAISLLIMAQALIALSRHDDAWSKAAESLAIGRQIEDHVVLSLAAALAVDIAVHVSRANVVEIYGEWQALSHAHGDDEDGTDPALWISVLFAAATRARAFTQLDALIKKGGTSLEFVTRPVYFGNENGEVIARIAQHEGRAEGYAAAAGIFPRISAFVARLPPEKRDERWLPNIIAGFAGACRDHGLLRDVATLLTVELAPQASESATLLGILADIDESDDAEAVLARADPDMATLIRKLRDLPDPPPAPVKRPSRRPRKRLG